MNNQIIIITLLILTVSCSSGQQQKEVTVNSPPRISNPEIKPEQITLPEGFRIEVYLEDIDDARSMVLGDRGTLFVGNRSGDKVFAVTDKNSDYRGDAAIVIAEGLNMPNGVAFRNGDLYVAEVSRILRFPGIEDRLDDPPDFEVVTDRFPEDRHHGWKFIAFGPGGKLYVPVGAPCNVCNPDNEIYSTICRISPDGSGFEIFAHGVRNTVGFDWHPDTDVLWFTDNGRDLMGDNIPDDELNRAPEPGMHFGFPFCHQGDVPDPEFGEEGSCSKFTPPVQNLGPHVAALGMRFYNGEMFPGEYRGRIFIALHGSWNRSEKIGYKVVTVQLDGSEVVGYEDFATGWLKDEDVWGRPVDVLVLDDGSLLVSDDYANCIYRITYEG